MACLCPGWSPSWADPRGPLGRRILCQVGHSWSPSRQVYVWLSLSPVPVFMTLSSSLPLPLSHPTHTLQGGGLLHLAPLTPPCHGPQSGNKHKCIGRPEVQEPGATPATVPEPFLPPLTVCLRAMAKPQQHLTLHETIHTKRSERWGGRLLEMKGCLPHMGPGRPQPT